MVPISQNDIPIHTPEFCPNPSCQHHFSPQQPNWYYRHGRHNSKVRGSIQRFRCRSCGKTCSTQTFSLHYWTHQHWNFTALENMLTSSAGQRQIGRSTVASGRVIKNRCSRLARNYLAIYYAALQDHQISENCAFDGFESFVRSQYFPANWNILVGSDSLAVYGITGALLRRKGCMTKQQRDFRDMIDPHWKRPRNAVAKSCVQLFRDIEPRINTGVEDKPWVISTDEHRSYPAALRKVPAIKTALQEGKIRHVTVSSRKKRDTRNALFPVNYIDREIRKDLGDHARETVKFAREVNMSAQRLIIELGSHTFGKPMRIPNSVQLQHIPTHGDAAGLTSTEKVRNLLKRRYTHRFVHSRASGKGNIAWIDAIWLQRYENPPVVHPVTGEKITERSPGSGWCAQHLLV